MGESPESRGSGSPKMGGDPPPKRPRLIDDAIGIKPQSVETGVESTTVVFHWHIRNYAAIRRNDCFLHQQKFRFKITDAKDVESTWEFALKRIAGADVNDNKDWIAVRQKLIKISAPPEAGEPPTVVWSKCMIEIKDVDGVNTFYRQSEKIAESIPGKVLVRKKFLPRDTKLEKLPLVRGTLTIHVTFQVLTVLTLSAPLNDRNNSLTIFQRGASTKAERFMASLENDRKYADVTITSNDGVEFRAHKLVLSKKSSVFEAMLNTKESESGSGSDAIKCEDLSGKCIKALLHFIYSGNLTQNWTDADNLAEISYAACKYHLKDLIEFLDENLGSYCTVKDAPRMLILANKLNMKIAQKEIMKVIKKNSTNGDEFLGAIMSLNE